jgi:DHA1 family bicyclomycin/chloramphenicol resistance-like MFS transporter
MVVIALFLPKGYTPDPAVSLRAKPMLNTFWKVLKNPVFFTYAVAGAFSFASIGVYVAGSPIIFMELYHVSPQTYGFIFALLSVGFVGSNQLNVLLLRKFQSMNIFRVALVSQFVILLVFLIGAFNNWYGLTATIVMLFLSLSCLGFTYPNASAIALSPFTSNIGTASALIGFLQIGVAGIASACVGLFDANTMVPVVTVMTATSFIAVAVLTAGKRKISVAAP